MECDIDVDTNTYSTLDTIYYFLKWSHFHDVVFNLNYHICLFYFSVYSCCFWFNPNFWTLQNFQHSSPHFFFYLFFLSYCSLITFIILCFSCWEILSVHKSFLFQVSFYFHWSEIRIYVNLINSQGLKSNFKRKIIY